MVIKSLKYSGLLLKGVSEAIQNEVQGQEEVFFSMLLSTLGASLLGNILAGKGVNRAGQGFIRAVSASKISLIKDFFFFVFNTASSFN